MIGKMFEDSGLYDILVESGIYGSNVALVLFQGKSYNRGVRAHKIVQDGLLRLQWQAFLLWMENKEIQADVLYPQLVDACQQSANGDDLKPNFRLLLDSTGPFCSQGKVVSRLFHFWSNYIDMVMLLRRLIRAEREGLWALHLNAVAEMTAYFSAMERVNYAR